MGNGNRQTPEHLSNDALLELSMITRVGAYISLRALGPLRARQLAEIWGVAESAMAADLAAMADLGLVVKDDELSGKTKQTWMWRALPGGVRVRDTASDDALADDQQRALTALHRATIGEQGKLIERWVDRAPSWPAQWRGAARISDGILHLTPEQLDAFDAEIMAVRRKWASQFAELEQAQPGSKPVMVIIDAFPYPDQVQ